MKLLFISAGLFIHNLILLGVSLFVFLASIQTLNPIDRMNSLKLIGPAASIYEYSQQAYQLSLPYHITSSYGLFRSMTGVGQLIEFSADHSIQTVQRPELIFEGHDHSENHHPNTGWHEIHFRYKPGRLMSSPLQVAPHQPRLDWQLWFVPLNSPHYAPLWYYQFIHQLLAGSESVYNLIESNQYYNVSHQPKSIRVWLYHYQFTQLIQFMENQGPKPVKSIPKQWWKRNRIQLFTETLQLNSTQIKQRLEQFNLIDPCGAQRAQC